MARPAGMTHTDGMTHAPFNPEATRRLDALLQAAALALYQADPNGTQARTDAVSSARLGCEVQKLVAEGADPCGCGATGLETQTCPFLATAAELGSAEVVRVLLAAGAEPNQASVDTGDAPLHLARTADVVRLLVAAGAQLETLNATLAEDEQGMTPLHRAVLVGNRDTVRALLEAGAQPNAANANGEPLLHAAVFAGTDILRDLLDAGADPDALDRYERDAVDRMNGGFLSDEARRLRLAMLEAARLARTMDAPSSAQGTRPRI